ADRQTADGIAGQIKRCQCIQTPAAKIEVQSSLNDAEERLVAPCLGFLAEAGPTDGAINRLGELVAPGGQGGALVESHDHVGAEFLLNVNRRAGIQPHESAIEVRFE